MSVKVNIPSYLQPFTSGYEVVEVTGSTTGECLRNLSKQFPDIGNKLFNEGGELISYISIYLNKEFVNTDELNKPVNDGDELHVFYLLGGG
ncbi:MAG TPA: MoaD/ThiS family protein [Dehalococcoidia bacterium]|nr:MoaD/ThiS family protein [Dehalococcoidia bacterium]